MVVVVGTTAALGDRCYAVLLAVVAAMDGWIGRRKRRVSVVACAC